MLSSNKIYILDQNLPIKKKKKIHRCIGLIIKSNRQGFPPNQFRRIFSSPLHGYYYKIIHMNYLKNNYITC